MVSLQIAEEIIWQKIKTLMITQAQRKRDYLKKKKTSGIIFYIERESK